VDWPVSRRTSQRRKVYVNGIDKIWAADLVDMQAFSKYNKGVKCLLAVFSLNTDGWFFWRTKPEKLWVDKVKEFYNKHVQQLVQLYSTENEEKSSVVERWNRTMKEKMFKYFTANSTRKYIDILDEFVNRYNNTVHSSIKMTPTEASKKEKLSVPT